MNDVFHGYIFLTSMRNYSCVLRTGKKIYESIVLMNQMTNVINEAFQLLK